MWKYIITTILSSILLLSGALAATISGKVVGEKGEELISATVRILNANGGTVGGAITDNDGNYTIDDVTTGKPISLKASYAGYEPQQKNLTIQGDTTVDFILATSEVVVEDIVTTACRNNKKGQQGYFNYDTDTCVYCPLGEVPNNDEDGCIADPDASTEDEVDPQDQAEKNANDPNHKDHGIKCDPTTVMYGSCGMDVYNMLGIRQSNPDTTPDEFVQDIVLTATSFIGTVLTFALVISGLMIIFGGANEGTASRGRQGIKYALIGYVVVLCSYSLIRLVQYIAAG